MKYNYKLIRSDRKTISVTICADNSIVVRAPRKSSENTIENFLENKSSWIDKKIAKNNCILVVNSSVKSYETVLVRGENIPLTIGMINGYKDGTVYIKSLSNLQKVMCDNFGDEFLERFMFITHTFGFEVTSVKFRSYKARWGCCDSYRNIVFNYKILMLPKDLQSYIIIHELCHTKYMNHSKCFWAEVKRYCADYPSKRNRLKEYAFLTRLYP